MRREIPSATEIEDLAMIWWIGAFLLPACLLGGWYFARRPLRLVMSDLNHDQARRMFRYQREWLEARFVTALHRLDPIEGQRWEDATWHDEISWARDRRSRQLLALVGVHFESGPFGEDEDPNQFATAVFEFRKGQWRAEGTRMAAMLPHEACLRNQRFVPVVPPPHRA